MAKTKITKKCAHCGKSVDIFVNIDGIVKYNNGEFIQNCFPELSAGEREMLISGICEDCWNKLMGPYDE